ncbi:MAG: hypothetical protein KBA03_00185 [Anaerolineaceae bacterium]|nr:hypothetical protein [Anaerolineaceae bacterium]
MNKQVKAKPFFLILGLVFSLLAGIVIGKSLRYKNSPILELLPINSSRSSIIEEKPQENQGPSDMQNPENSANLLSKEAKFMNFAGLDLLNGEVGFRFESKCDGGVAVSIPPIQISAWHESVFEDNEFDIGKNISVGWEHLGYDGLWIHSGWDFWNERSPATDLQYFIETDALNEVQDLKTIETRLNECLRGSFVSLSEGDTVKNGVVAAAVRIPATAVDEMSGKTMELVPWLAEKYPESGFDRLSENALLINFCGRAALDERTDPKAGYWTQSRYILAIEPLD